MFDYVAPSLTALLGEEVEINLIGQDTPSRETLAAIEAAGVWIAAKTLVVVVDVPGGDEDDQSRIENVRATGVPALRGDRLDPASSRARTPFARTQSRNCESDQNRVRLKKRPSLSHSRRTRTAPT